MNEQQLTHGSVLKKLLLFAFPIIAANLLQAMYGTVDLMIVGWFSDASQVSAVSTGSMTMQTITGIIVGLTMGSTVLIGQLIGKKDYSSASRAIASSFAVFITTGIVLTCAITAGARSISVVMNAPVEAMEGTTRYISICGGGILCIILFNSISGMMRGIGDSRTPLILMAVACAGNILGDLLLVGHFSMGCAGAAYATVGAQGLSVIVAALIVRKKGVGFEIDRSNLKVAKRETRTILRYGLPIAAQDALTGVSFMIILAILNGFGVVASAGVGVAERLCGLMFIIPGGMMSAVSAFSAQNVGAGRLDRARKGTYISIIISCAIGLVMFAAGFLFGKQISSIFTPDADICAASADYLRSYSVDCIIVGINFSLMGYLNGMGRTGFVALQGILSTFLVRIPVSWFMSRIPGVSLFRVGFATPLATVFAIALTILYIKFSVNRKRFS